MVNKVILIGRVGKDPDVRHLDSGVAKASFSLATDEKFKNRSGERVSQTEWHNIVMWRQLAEIAEKFVRKGSLLYIEGKIRSRSYEDNAGAKRYITEIEADTMQMLDRRQDDGGSRPASSSYADNSGSIPSSPSSIETSSDGPDDLPF